MHLELITAVVQNECNVGAKGGDFRATPHAAPDRGIAGIPSHLISRGRLEQALAREKRIPIHAINNLGNEP